MPAVLLVVYCTLIVAASLTGGWLPALMRLTHTRMQVMVSFVSGLMLGVGLLHMLPHAVAELQHTDSPPVETAAGWMLAGLLGMFLLIRAFHFHQHEPEIGGQEAGGRGQESGVRGQESDSQLSTLNSQPGNRSRHPHHLSWTGVALGLALHTLIDGMALAASVEAEARQQSGAVLLGAGTFLAILLHKPLDAVSITSLMVAAGWPGVWRNAVNAGFALMCPLGVVLFALGIERLTVNPSLLVGGALAFSAGAFLCISLGDLLPEVEFHSHDRVTLSAALLGGIAVAVAVRMLTPGHVH